MELNAVDIGVFVAFFAVVIGVSMFKSRREKTSEDYFLAGRGLTWPLIGLSIIAANISTEQFVGMSGQGAGGVGLAVAGYQLLGAVTIVVVAWLFLPRFLRAGIYTMPEYLEYRYNSATRAIMALYTVAIYVLVLVAAVVYSGALALHTIFVDVKLTQAAWMIGGIAAVYTIWGGLKAVAWADLFLGSTLLLGGLLTMLLGFHEIGGVRPFLDANADRLHMVLPADHPQMPWTVLVVGLWIPNFYYCGLNQFIVQRTLAARDLKHSQLGIIFAAGLWLLVPFVIVLPGIMAVQLYGGELGSSDQAYPVLIRNLIPQGIRGFIFAALAGAVISSLASLLNSAATISTMDLYQRYLRRNASQKSLVWMGRVLTLLFVLFGCLLAPYLASPRFGGIFKYIQEFQGFISPGIVAAFAFGMAVRKTPPAAGLVALALNPPIYGLLFLFSDRIAFLNRMAITFGLLIASMAVVTITKPLTEPKQMPVRQNFDMRPAPLVLLLGGLVIAAVIVFYLIFW
jgi:SSS family solute:Na+ symporter